MERSGDPGTRSAERGTAGAPFRQKVLVDERGTGLRLTWHPEVETCVLSTWRGETCVATFRLPVGEVADLSAFLSCVLSDWSLDVLADRAAAQAGSVAVPPAAAAVPSPDPAAGSPDPSPDPAAPGASLRDRLRRAGRALRSPS